MEQRTLRLGDIVDDYCPRERRVTNHAIVAIVDNTIRQTRCSTCEAEHEYKEAKVPKKRPKTGDGSDLSGGVLVAPKPASNGAAVDRPEPQVEHDAMGEEPVHAAASSNGADSTGTASESDEASPAEDHEPVVFTHRPLIRASLPRTDNDPPPPRAIPEFTMHQRPVHGRGFGGGRGGFRHGHQGGGGHQSFRGGHSHSNSGSNGNGHEPDGNRAPQSPRPPGPGGPGGPGGGGGRRRRRRRR